MKATVRSMLDEQSPLAGHEKWSALLEQVALQQDKQAFAALFDHFAPLLKAYLFSIGGRSLNEASIEELVQEAMLSVWRKAHLYDRKKAAASTWIYTLTRNLRIDWLRRQNRQETDELPDEWEDSDEHEPVVSLHMHKMNQELQASLKMLPIDQKEVLMKVYMEDKSHQDVAQELNLPLGTVKSRVRLALQKLKVNLSHVEL